MGADTPDHMGKKPRTVKTDTKFRATSWSIRRKLFRNGLSIAGQTLPLALRKLAGEFKHLRSFLPHTVGHDFFGINVAPSPTRELEDLHMQRLCELGITQVRTDYAYASNRELTERWIHRLCAQGFDVLLHLVQPAEDASQMERKAPQQRWGQFVESVLARFEGKIRLAEIGSTPNRHSWSGYSIGDYVTAFSLAREIADQRGVELIGPNVEDFAPYFLVAILARLRRAGIRLPFVTDNLFVDRAGEPETFDPHVFRSWFMTIHRLDLVRKSYYLDLIGRACAMGPPICTYTYWTINPKPWKSRPRYISEEQQANHLVRYFTYSAAAGHLRRVYWGQMSGFFKGIIDDGARLRFDPPAVFQRLLNDGAIEDYRARPAFESFRVMVEQLRDTNFVRKRSSGQSNAYVFEFEKRGHPFFVAWTKNGCQADFSAIVPKQEIVRMVDRDGKDMAPCGSITITEKPLYLYPATPNPAQPWSAAGVGESS